MTRQPPTRSTSPLFNDRCNVHSYHATIGRPGIRRQLGKDVPVSARRQRPGPRLARGGCSPWSGRSRCWTPSPPGRRAGARSPSSRWPAASTARPPGGCWPPSRRTAWWTAIPPPAGTRSATRSPGSPRPPGSTGWSGAPITSWNGSARRPARRRDPGRGTAVRVWSTWTRWRRPAVLTVNWLARPVPLHATSTGKAWLAWLPEPEVRSVLGPVLEGFTDATVTDVSRLLGELGRIRERGYAVSAGELEPTLCGVSAPVLRRGRGPAARGVQHLGTRRPGAAVALQGAGGGGDRGGGIGGGGAARLRPGDRPGEGLTTPRAGRPFHIVRSLLVICTDRA